MYQYPDATETQNTTKTISSIYHIWCLLLSSPQITVYMVIPVSEGQAAPWVSCTKRGCRGNRLTCSLGVQVLDHGCQQSCSTAEPFSQRHILQELSLLPDETDFTIIFPLSCLLPFLWTGGLSPGSLPCVKFKAFQRTTHQEVTQLLIVGKPFNAYSFPQIILALSQERSKKKTLKFNILLGYFPYHLWKMTCLHYWHLLPSAEQ